MKSVVLSPLVFVVVLLVACDSDGVDNGKVQISNKTDRTVRVYYAKEIRDEAVGEGDSDRSAVTVEQKVVAIDAGAVSTLSIQKDLWDGEFSVVYGGIIKVFDIDFEVIGTTLIDVKTGDFIDSGCTP